MIHPAFFIAFYFAILIGAVALCVAAQRGDDDIRHALDEQEILENLRPFSSAVHVDPVVRLMREGLTADEAVRRVYEDRQS